MLAIYPTEQKIDPDGKFEITTKYVAYSKCYDRVEISIRFEHLCSRNPQLQLKWSELGTRLNKLELESSVSHKH